MGPICLNLGDAPGTRSFAAFCPVSHEYAGSQGPRRTYQSHLVTWGPLVMSDGMHYDKNIPRIPFKPFACSVDSH
jgi:hypothetical protein